MVDALTTAKVAGRVAREPPNAFVRVRENDLRKGPFRRQPQTGDMKPARIGNEGHKDKTRIRRHTHLARQLNTKFEHTTIRI